MINNSGCNNKKKEKKKKENTFKSFEDRPLECKHMCGLMEGPGWRERWWCEIGTVVRRRDCDVFTVYLLELMPNERRAGLHTKKYTLTLHRRRGLQHNWPFFFFFLLRLQAYPNKAAFKEESFNLCILCQRWLTDSNVLSCIYDTWQPLGDVIFEDDLWIMAISAQIKAVIRVHLPFGDDCVHCNFSFFFFSSRNIYTAPVLKIESDSR